MNKYNLIIFYVKAFKKDKIILNKIYYFNLIFGILFEKNFPKEIIKFELQYFQRIFSFSLYKKIRMILKLTQLYKKGFNFVFLK